MTTPDMTEAYHNQVRKFFEEMAPANAGSKPRWYSTCRRRRATVHGWSWTDCYA
jgi:hypothetical protein